MTAFAHARDRLGPGRFFALLVFVPSAALVLFGAWSLARGARSRALDLLAHEQTLAVRLALHSLTEPLAANLRGLEVLARQPSLQRVLNDDSAAHRQALARDAIALADTLGTYDKVRWIDQNGLERVRVDWRGNRAVAVPEQELQSKRTRNFVLDTKNLPLGSVVVSPLDLNVDQEHVEVPHNPTLRFSRALIDDAGRRRGILVVNVQARQLLEGFSSVARDFSDGMMLVSAQGHGILSPDHQDESAFLLGRSPSLERRFPDAWPLMRSLESGQRRLASGLWTWRSVRPFPTYVLTSAGSGSVQGPSRPGGLHSANRRSWTVVSRVDPRQLAALERQVTLPYAGTAALMLGALAGISSLVGTTLKQRHRAVERLEVLAENAADVVFRSSPEGALEWVSPSVQQVLGFPPEALLGRRGPDLIVAEDLPRFQAAHQQVLAGHKAEFEARFRSADGSPRWLAVSIRPLLDRRAAGPATGATSRSRWRRNWRWPPRSNASNWRWRMPRWAWRWGHPMAASCGSTLLCAPSSAVTTTIWSAATGRPSPIRTTWRRTGS